MPHGQTPSACSATRIRHVNVPPPRNVWTPDTLRGGGVILYGLIENLSRRDALTPEEAAALREVLGPLQPVAAGTDIVREGARPEHSTLLTSGFTARYSTLAVGGRQITELNVSGDFVDLHGFVMKQMDHGVVALTEFVIAPGGVRSRLPAASARASLRARSPPPPHGVGRAVRD